MHVDTEYCVQFEYCSVQSKYTECCHTLNKAISSKVFTLQYWYFLVL